MHEASRSPFGSAVDDKSINELSGFAFQRATFTNVPLTAIMSTIVILTH